MIERRAGLAAAALLTLAAAGCTGGAEPSAGGGPATTPVPAVEAARSVPVEPSTVRSARIGLVVLADVPTFQLTEAGLRDSLADCSSAAIEVLKQDAHGDIPSLGPLTEGLLDEGVDMIVTITTPAAQAAHRVVGARGGSTPVVFATVTDPVSAGLATGPAAHEPWITGSASPPPVAAVIDAAQEIVPDLAVIGVIRNPAEANSQFAVQAVQTVAGARGLALEIVDVSDPSEVAAAARTLADRSIDAFLVPTDTTVFAGLPALAEVAGELDLLVIGTDPNQAASGAAIAMGSDYYGSGFRAGGIACRVLSGEATPADFDVVTIESVGISVSEAAMAAQGVTIPADLLAEAEFAN